MPDMVRVNIGNTVSVGYIRKEIVSLIKMRTFTMRYVMK